MVPFLVLLPLRESTAGCDLDFCLLHRKVAYNLYYRQHGAAAAVPANTLCRGAATENVLRPYAQLGQLTSVTARD